MQECGVLGVELNGWIEIVWSESLAPWISSQYLTALHKRFMNKET
jgi:hypothetical protein